MFRRNAQSTICQAFFVAVQLLQIGSHSFRGALKQTAQFRFNVGFPLRTKLRFSSVCWSTEETLFGSQCSVGTGTCRNLAEELGQKRVKLRELDMVLVPANLHIS